MVMHMAYGTVVDQAKTDSQGRWIAPAADCTCGWEWTGESVFAYDGDAGTITRQIVRDRAADMAENHRIGWEDDSRLALLDVSGTMQSTSRPSFEMDVPLRKRVELHEVDTLIATCRDCGNEWRTTDEWEPNPLCDWS